MEFRGKIVRREIRDGANCECFFRRLLSDLQGFLLDFLTVSCNEKKDYVKLEGDQKMMLQDLGK